MNRNLGQLMCLALVSGTTSAVGAAPFTAGNLVVVQVGDGGGFTSDTDFMPVQLREFNLAGVPQQAIPLPTTISGNQNALAMGRDRSAGQLNVSQDGNYLLLAGTNTVPRDLVISTQIVGRTVARIGWDGTIDTSTLVQGPYGTAGEVGVRSVASVDGSGFWVAGKGSALDSRGVQYIPFGTSNAVPITDTGFESRHLSIVNGQLYNTQNGIESVGNGLPTTGPVDRSTFFPNLTGRGLLNSGVMFDLNPSVPGIDTVYFSYENQQTLPEIEKWQLSGGVWSQSEVFDIALSGDIQPSQGALFLIGRQVGSDVELFTTTRAPKSGTPRNSLVQILDTAAGATYATLATADENYSFRGIAFVPSSEVSLPGDYNGDGFVNAGDYTIWRDTFGQTGTGLAADGNGSGSIDAGDYDVWKQGFGGGSGAAALGSSAIPEPHLLTLVLTIVPALCWTRRNRLASR